jgi:hypothetical protein
LAERKCNRLKAYFLQFYTFCHVVRNNDDQSKLA